MVVELKQWTQALADPEDPNLVHIDAYGRRPVLHPGEQVAGYVQYFTDFLRALEHNPESIRGAAYLHNATEAGVASLRVRPETEVGLLWQAGPVFRGRVQLCPQRALRTPHAA